MASDLITALWGGAIIGVAIVLAAEFIGRAVDRWRK